MGKRIALFAVMIGLALAISVWADDNVRAVQEQLRDGGFYSGEIDGAYSSQLAAALTRYQIRKGLAVTGQLDVDTSNALGAKPAVTTGTAAPEQTSETWRRLRRREPQTTSTNAREKSSPRADRADEEQSSPVATPTTSELATRSADSPSVAAPISGAKPASAPPAPVSDTGSSRDGDISTERLRDYVGAFVLAGLDPHVGSEAEFFADRVKYYDQGVIDREKIRNDLQDYAARWPERHFWFAGNLIIEPQHRKRVRVTFPLRYELRNGATYSTGTINKTVVLESIGDDLQIVAVSESKAE
jgi:peptidoglycan hydrolase-like protein with peptidoglycan-binding domain